MATDTVDKQRITALENSFAQFQANIVKVPDLTTPQQLEFHKVLDGFVTIDGYKVLKANKAGDYSAIEVSDLVFGITPEGWNIVGVVTALPYSTYDANENYPNMQLYVFNGINN